MELIDIDGRMFRSCLIGSMGVLGKKGRWASDRNRQERALNEGSNFEYSGYLYDNECINELICVVLVRF